MGRWVDMKRLLAAATAAVFATAAVAFAATDGTYKGKIKEGKTDVSVTVKGGKVTKVEAVVYGYCNGTGMLLTVAYPPAGGGKPIKIKSDGSFAKAFAGSPDVEDDLRTVKGIFKGAKKVTGTVSIQGSLCQADGSYTAKR